MTAQLGAPDLPGPWSAILDEARRYPSPHNSQPITVRVHDDRRACANRGVQLPMCR